MSDLAQHLATIDLLRARPFPAQRGRQAAVVRGPGYHLAELATSEECCGSAHQYPLSAAVTVTDPPYMNESDDGAGRDQDRTSHRMWSLTEPAELAEADADLSR